LINERLDPHRNTGLGYVATILTYRAFMGAISHTLCLPTFDYLDRGLEVVEYSRSDAELVSDTQQFLSKHFEPPRQLRCVR
jgi:hypothetical protein